MAVNIVKELKKCCLRCRSKNKKQEKLEFGNEELLPSRIQQLVSQGEYNGLSPHVKAEGAFVQYNSDGTYYRRVGLGVTNTELLIVTEPLPDNEDDDVEGLKINLVFPLPAVLFILLDNRSKRFAVCTCVGILMFFEMCIDEPNFDENWQRWRRVIFLQLDGKLHTGFPLMEAPSWQPKWSSPYVINLSEQNDIPTYEFLAEKKGNLHRTLYFIQQPFTIRLVRHFGVQTTGHVTSRGRSQKSSQKTEERKRNTLSRENLKPLRRESLKPGRLSEMGSPEESLKSSAKSYLEKLDQNRAGHNMAKTSDSIHRENYKTKIVLSASGAKDESRHSETEDGDTRGGLKLKLDKKNKILPDHDFERSKAKNDTKDKTEIKFVKDIDVLLLQSKGHVKNRTILEQRLSSFYGGVKCLLETSSITKKKSYSTPVHKACSCNDLLLTDEGDRLSKADQILANSWDSGALSSSLTASDKILAKKYMRYTQKMKQQCSKRPLEMSSPTDDICDIDDLVEEFSEKRETETGSHRSGRELWMIAKRKFFSRRTHSHLQDVVYTLFLKVSPQRESKEAKNLTDLKPLAVALELFTVSKKLLLSVTAADVMNFTNNKGKLEVNSLFKILKFSDDVTRMVALQIIDCKPLLDRLDIVRFFIDVCKYLLLKYHDFQSFIAIMRALTSLHVYRLRNTWATFYMEYPLQFSNFICFCNVLSPAKGFQSYRSRVEFAMARGEPCIPMLEHFLTHCKRWSDSYGTPVGRIRFNLKKTKIKKGKSKRQKKTSTTKENIAVPSPEEIHLKPILQQPKLFEDPFKRKKAVRFYYKVEVAERRSSIFDILRGTKVPLGDKIVEPKQESDYSDEEREHIERFSEETATNIIDGVMQDIIGQNRNGDGATRGKKKHQKTSGIYLKKKAPTDDDEHEGELEQKEDKTEKRLAQTNDIIKEEKIKHELETNVLPSAIKGKKQKHTFLSKLVDRQTSKPKTNKDDDIKPSQREGIKDQKTQDTEKGATNEVTASTSASKDKKGQQMVDSSKTSISSEETSKPETKRRLSIGPKPETPNIKRDLPNEAMPTRKRRMSVMEMKKQNRRMSLFEQAEQKRDIRRDNTLDSAVHKRMQEMRRKGSIAVDLLQPDNLKALSRNNNFQESQAQSADDRQTKAHKSNKINKTSVNMTMDRYGKDNNDSKKTLHIGNHHSSNKTRIKNPISWAVGDHSDIDIRSYVRQTNNNNTNKLQNQSGHRKYRNKIKVGAINPCRSWSGNCLDFSRLLSRKKCELCGNKECVYKNGLWKTFVQIQMSTLKCDIHSSAIANSCLKSAVTASSRLSDKDLLMMSFHLE